MGLFESDVPIASITVMVQKEVADRMQVGPGTKDYGALSLAVQYYADPYIVANVPPNCFMPRPKVGSAVIRLTRHREPPVDVRDEIQRTIESCGFQAGIRGETLTLADFARLANALADGNTAKE